jgi:nucleoside-diphosphate-sugar epimerase
MAGRVFVTGASGFVGSAVVDELLSRGYAVTALVNRRGLKDNRTGTVREVRGSLFNDAALDEGIRGCDAVIHLVGIIMEKPSKGVTFERIHHEGTLRIVAAAARNGVRRYLHMSALGARPGAVSGYHRTKYLAEEDVRASALDWTIFRPSVIHGPGGELMQMEAGWARGTKPPFLFMPYFGGGLFGGRGAGKLQPVYVGDVARAIIDALSNPKTIREIYPLGGAEVVTWPQMHRTVSQAVVGKRRLTLPVPAWYAKLLTRVAPRFVLPFNRDQVIMSQEDNTCDLAKFTDDFGWAPRAFEETLKAYAARL